MSSEPLRILAIAGSLREASINRRLARLAARLATDADATIEVEHFDALDQVEPYDGDLEAAAGMPAGAAALAAAVRRADAVFIATPEYNGSIPGQLKNALDWLSRPDGAVPDSTGLQASPLFGVPVAVASASTGQFGAVWARDELVKVLRTQGARPLAEPSVAIPRGADAFDESGKLVNAAQHERLSGLLDTLATTARTVRAALSSARGDAPSEVATAT